MIRPLIAMLLLLAGLALPMPSPRHLPRWRGFNLLEHFQAESCRPFREEDFRLISELGFNFVRLPLDYRAWIVGGDASRIDPSKLRDIDEAVAFGQRYGVHVCINLHRAPGYCVGAPAEARDLFTDAEALRLCALHWATFARRYRGVPSTQLSFNLINEPMVAHDADYVRVVRVLTEAIRREDPQRLIIADGTHWGNTPVDALASLGIAQATRGYEPMMLTHYRAKWITGSDAWTVPRWPMAEVEPYLYGPWHKGICGPLVIMSHRRGAQTLRLRVDRVSKQALLVISADGREVLRRSFTPGPGVGDWKEVHYKPQWRVYQNRYDCDCVVTLPAGTKRIEVSNLEGDWLRWSSLTLEGPEGAVRVSPNWEWGVHPQTLDIDARGAVTSSEMRDRDWLRVHQNVPWKRLEARGVGVMVGEFGCYNQTPHHVALRWMRDNLENWRDAGWGWALWNFRGSFGPLDSGRSDVRYEDFHGHKLDREMMDLLRRS